MKGGKDPMKRGEGASGKRENGWGLGEICKKFCGNMECVDNPEYRAKRRPRGPDVGSSHKEM